MSKDKKKYNEYDVTEPVRSVQTVEEYDQLLENYKLQNPDKYALKEAKGEFAKRRKEIEEANNRLGESDVDRELRELKEKKDADKDGAPPSGDSAPSGNQPPSIAELREARAKELDDKNTVPQLKKLAEELKLEDLPSKKADLIEAILDAEANK